MNSLKQAWKMMQFKMAVCEAFSPPQAVMNEMKKDGWRFEIEQLPPIATRSGAMITPSYLLTKTPEGKYVDEAANSPDYERYRKARTQAARQVYGIN